MKRIASAILAVLMVASLATATVFAASKVADRKTCEANIATITVDGKIDEAWAYANEYAVTTVKAKDDTWYKDTMVSGKDYAGMTMKVLWDGAKTLYVLAEVTDATPNKEFNGTESYKADSIEIQFELNNTMDAVAPTQWRFLSDGTQSNGTALAMGYAKTEKGWLIEAAVDVEKVGGVGQYLAFDVQYNDNATGAKERQVCIAWCDSTNTSHKDASKLGQCLLGATKVADIIAAEAAKNTTTAAPATEAPKTETPAAPATFDAAVVIAVVAAVAGAGVVVSKKKH